MVEQHLVGGFKHVFFSLPCTDKWLVGWLIFYTEVEATDQTCTFTYVFVHAFSILFSFLTWRFLCGSQKSHSFDSHQCSHMLVVFYCSPMCARSDWQHRDQCLNILNCCQWWWNQSNGFLPGSMATLPDGRSGMPIGKIRLFLVGQIMWLSRIPTIIGYQLVILHDVHKWFTIIIDYGSLGNQPLLPTS